MIRTIEDLRGPAGRLEAVVNEGSDSATLAALVCHPHPPSGGTMHTRAVFQTMKVFEGLGIPTVRFNFRGVGVSEGEHDDGRGEVDDVRAAIGWIESTLQLPVLLAGFSFGANVGWRAACGDTRVHGLIGLGMPLRAGGRQYTYEFVGGCTQPKLLVTGAEDPFASRKEMLAVMSAAPPPLEMHWVDGAEHFFMGVPGSPAPKLPQMQQFVRAWVQQQFLGD